MASESAFPTGNQQGMEPESGMTIEPIVLVDTRPKRMKLQLWNSGKKVHLWRRIANHVVCEKCGQDYDATDDLVTVWCRCWKMRLPRKKETPACSTIQHF